MVVREFGRVYKLLHARISRGREKGG